VNDDLSLVDSVVTDDESWYFQDEPQTKRQRMEWRSPSSPRRKIFDFGSQKHEEMLVTSFGGQGMVQKEFVPPGQMVNKEYYVAVLPLLIKEFVE
jgi:hypothetical protein